MESSMFALWNSSNLNISKHSRNIILFCMMFTFLTLPFKIYNYDYDDINPFWIDGQVATRSFMKANIANESFN